VCVLSEVSSATDISGSHSPVRAGLLSALQKWH